MLAWFARRRAGGQAPADRAAQWHSDGIEVNPLPPNMSLLQMRGGHALLGVSPGDDVELYVPSDSGKKDKGQWVGGYVAGSGVEIGEPGEPYDGQEVVFVCKAEDYAEEGPLSGDYWPREYLRLARGSKTAFSGADKGKGSGQRLVDKTQAKGQSASFYEEPTVRIDAAEALFRYYPEEWRDWHGRWTEGGPHRALPTLPDPLRLRPHLIIKHATTMAKLGYTEDSVARACLKLAADAARLSPKEYAYDADWYFRANKLAKQWATWRWKVPTWKAAGILAALSPQTQWSTTNEPFEPPNSNQGIALRLGDLMFNEAVQEQEVTITPKVAYDLRMMLWDLYVQSKQAKKEPPNPRHYFDLLDLEHYNGDDPNFEEWKGKSFLGRWQVKDLPADIVAGLFQKRLGGLGTNEAKAIRIARGEDPGVVLGGGGKTRSFYNNILDPWHSQDVTIDVHMGRALANNLGLTDEGLADMTKYAERYRVLADGLKQAAAQLMLRPHALQAIIWEHWKRLHDAAERAKETRKQTKMTKEEREALRAQEEKLGVW